MYEMRKYNAHEKNTFRTDHRALALSRVTKRMKGHSQVSVNHQNEFIEITSIKSRSRRFVIVPVFFINETHDSADIIMHRVLPHLTMFRSNRSPSSRHDA